MTWSAMFPNIGWGRFAGPVVERPTGPTIHRKREPIDQRRSIGPDYHGVAKRANGGGEV